MTVQVTTLANGFRVVSERMDALHSASVGLWVGAGARHERAEQNGVAHFLEHMAFKGTKRRNALQIAEAIEDVGGYLNAYTSREATAYYARVLEADVPLAVDVIADIVRNSIFDPRELEVERGVILQEIGQVLDTPDDVIFDWLQEVCYPDQPLGRSILGTAERVRAFSREDLQGFVGEHYRPGSMVLSAAGAVDHAELVRLAESLFGDLPAGQTPKPDPARWRGGERREVKPLEQAHVAMALETSGYLDEAFYTAQVLGIALGGGMSSRLFQEAREKRGLCYAIHASVGAHEETGALTIYAGTSGEDLPELASLVIDEIRRAGQDMSEAEVARARAQLKAGLLMGIESPSARAERLARMLLIWGRVLPIAEVIERIEAVDRGKVLEQAAALCAQGAPALAVLGPVEGAPPVEALAERLAA